ncbi:unnamed protein product, partial [Clonostachys rhizophaga]
DWGGGGLPSPSEHRESSPRTGPGTAEQGIGLQRPQQIDPMLEDFGTPEDVFKAFSYFQNQPYSFFHDDTFRQRLSEQAIPRHLVLAVMATAVRFCSHP